MQFNAVQPNKCHCVSYIPQKGETNQFNADADGEAGSKNVVWDDLKTLFPDVMNESQVLFLGALPMSYIF